MALSIMLIFSSSSLFTVVKYTYHKGHHFSHFSAGNSPALIIVINYNDVIEMQLL